jgi:cysteinyl-tRNA synthetase
MHNNMVTVNGQKMGKSLGNFINLEEFFTGNHPMLTQSYAPMTIRFFILQAHYRGTVDFSNEALQASEKGLGRLLEAYRNVLSLWAKRSEDSQSIDKTDCHPALDAGSPDEYNGMAGQARHDRSQSGFSFNELIQKSYEAMNDDLNTPIVISYLFEAVRRINAAIAGQIELTSGDIEELKQYFDLFLFDILGIRDDTKETNASYDSFAQAVDLLLQIRMQAKQNKDWATSDKIRNELSAIGFVIKDTKDGFEWQLKSG